jgi:DNA polymerase family B
MTDCLDGLSLEFVPYQERVRSSKRAPFVGVDGEGGDFHGNGGHEYLLLRAGDDVLETGSPLTTLQCLDFLAGLPKGRVYVSFFFDYDVTMMLRSMQPERLERLLNPSLRRKNPCSQAYPVDWGVYQIDYVPRKEFRVRRRKKGEAWTIINDVGTFFQEAFAKLLENNEVDGALPKWFSDEPELAETIYNIAVGKGQRAEFGPMTDYEREYNRLECELLARMMEKYRDMCDRLDLRPAKWQGPGQLVTAFFKREKFPRHSELEIYDQIPDFVAFANNGFYGGRFEDCIFGWVPGPVYQWDINSAYASVYHKLPCLRHSRWTKVRRLPTPDTDTTFIADVSFQHPRGWSVNTLPIRTDKGTLIFPRFGRGIYWSPEIDSARRHGVEVTLEGDCWVCEKRCDCEPFSRVYELYEERKRLGSSTQGRPLKLMLATLYGKFAQTVGCAPFASPIWAGLITSYTRSMLVDAAHATGNGGADVVMLATDGLYTTDDRPTLKLSKDIGDWSKEVHDSMLSVQSGVYVLPTTLKTRGVKGSLIAEHYIDMYCAWFKWLDNPDLALGPTVCIPIRQFVGLRLAIARGKPETAGLWVDVAKQITYDWESKRTAWKIAGTCLLTKPIQGSPGLRSKEYDRMIGGERAAERLLHDDQPDWAPTL